jgi:hypothetical protein
MNTPEIRPISSQFEANVTQELGAASPDQRLCQEYSHQEQEVISQMLSHAPSIIGEVVRLPENEKRPGGCLILWKKDRNQPLAFEVGTMTKPDKYPIFAMAKAGLLRDFLPSARLSGENLSLPSEQRYRVEFGGQFFDIPHGAVATDGGWILSFSGFEQEWDAGAMLALAVKSGVMGIDRAEQLAEQSVPVSQERTIGQCFSKLIPH